MKVQYNREDDVLMLYLSEDKIDHAEETEGVIIHFSAKGHPVLVEILDASDLLAKLTKITTTDKTGRPVTV